MSPDLARLLNNAVQQALSRYPRFRSIGPIALTTAPNAGPGESETYYAKDPNNPLPGNLTIQLRDPAVIRNRSIWPEYVALESIHGLQERDPRYQQMTDQFVRSMSNNQRAASYRTYLQDLGIFGPDDQSYDQWLRNVQAQEYIRGFLFPHADPGWIGPHGEGGYTPPQAQLFNRMRNYLMTSN